MTEAVLIAAAIVAVAVARFALDRLALWRHWRVGRLGPLLCVWGRKDGACLHCGTNARWFLPHDIPIRLEPRWEIFPICQPCWEETSEEQRLAACAKLINGWIADGRYGDSRHFDQVSFDEDRTAIFYAIKAGL